MDSARSCSGVICPIGGPWRSLTGVRSTGSPPQPAAEVATPTISAKHSTLAAAAARPLLLPADRQKRFFAAVERQGLGQGHRIPFCKDLTKGNAMPLPQPPT